MYSDQTRVSIFLNIFNVHVTRSPLAGRITDVTYTKGKFRVASLENASAENEKSTYTLESENGRLVFSMVAGLIARRIVSYKLPGEIVAAGDRVGLMKFGSRVDVFVGPEWHIAVKNGENVSAGTSVIARRASKEVGI